MKGLTVVLTCTFCFLSFAFSPGSIRATDSPVPIEWWATVWPQNPKYVEVKVVVKEGFCVKPELPFSVAYFNDRGEKLGTLKGNFVYRHKEMCAGTYRSYYELAYQATSTGEGLMYWTLIGSRPFSGRVFQTRR